MSHKTDWTHECAFNQGGRGRGRAGRLEGSGEGEKRKRKRKKEVGRERRGQRDTQRYNIRVKTEWLLLRSECTVPNKTLVAERIHVES